MAENDAPERIWMPRFPIERSGGFHNLPASAIQINKNDVEYVRANLAAPDTTQIQKKAQGILGYELGTSSERVAFQTGVQIACEILTVSNAVRQVRRDSRNDAASECFKKSFDYPGGSAERRVLQDISTALRAEKEKDATDV